MGRNSVFAGPGAANSKPAEAACDYACMAWTKFMWVLRIQAR